MLLLLLITSNSALASILPAPSNSRVVGGQDAVPGQFPWMASINDLGGAHSCGGTIINSKWILTAAHCLRSKIPEDLIIIVGIVNLIEDGDKYQAIQIISHPNYTSSTSQNDIGLIQVETDIVFGPNVQAIHLEAQRVAEVDSVLVGWGRTSYGSTISDHLQYVATKTLLLDQCLDFWKNNKVVDSHVCALTEQGEGACNGDSGGPLVSNNRQIGIVSWGSPCANGLPDVYTRISSFIEWISDNIK